MLMYFFLQIHVANLFNLPSPLRQQTRKITWLYVCICSMYFLSPMHVSGWLDVMHEAFLCICLLKDYPYALECLTSYNNILLVGTKQGLLLVYEITPKCSSHPTYFVPPLVARFTPNNKKVVTLSLTDVDGYSASSLPTNVPVSPATTNTTDAPRFATRMLSTRTLGSKPILKLSAVPELDLLLALSNGSLSAYRLQNCQLITTVAQSKGASEFAHCLYYSMDKRDAFFNHFSSSGNFWVLWEGSSKFFFESYI